MPRSVLGNVAQDLFILGTALLIFWQPLARQFPLKASDVVFGLALCASLLFSVHERRTAALHVASPRVILPPLALLGSLLVATLVGFWRYDLAMSRDGTILLARLAVCIALFVAIHHLSHIDTAIGNRVSLALLSPVVIFPAMLVPSLFGSMWVQGRFQGFTVNPNTSDVGFSIALAIAYALAIYEMHVKRRLRALSFAIIGVGMLIFIVWTQSRAYLAGACASVLLVAILTAPHLGLPKLRTVAMTALAFLLIVAANLMLSPHSLVNSYVARISWGTLEPSSSDTQSSGSGSRQTSAPAPAPSGRQALALSNWILQRGRPSFVSGQYGALDDLERLPSGGVRRLMENPHVQAAILYLELLPTNVGGLGVNYEEKFFLYFPWINNRHHGTNSILDIPIYGGVGAVLSIGYLMFLIARTTRDRLNKEPNENFPYAIGAAAAFWGLWIAAILLGSPIFDYQFWIVTAIALM
jgi:hypothetical protein